MLCVTPGSLALRNAFFGQGTGAIFLDDANCSPQNHSTLIECFASIDASVGDHDCQHREDASVVCSSDCELIFVLFGGSCSMEGGGGGHSTPWSNLFLRKPHSLPPPLPFSLLPLDHFSLCKESGASKCMYLVSVCTGKHRSLRR